MKRCCGCGESKALDQFNKRTSTRSQARCRTCQNAEMRAHYTANKRYYMEKTRRRKTTMAAMVREYKESRPCADCQKFYPYYVMDFDHRDPSKKAMAVAHATNRCGLKRLKEEMDKCDLVCANCHRIRTHRHRDHRSSTGRTPGLSSRELGFESRTVDQHDEPSSIG